MSVEKIISDWKKKQFRPIYWLEGDEEYFIDKAVDYAEHHILSESEASFNLSIFYGKDANWADVLNACRRYPMFAERQVVLLKEAQQMKDVEKLEPYMENPLVSTILVVSYKDKKLDARKKFSKLVKENGVVISTKKLYDRDIPAWTQDMVQSKGLTITPKGLALLSDHIGNDLSRIENEIEKLSVNLGKRTQINEDDIERYIGVSKEFNVFELQSALAAKDLSKAIRIVQYFESNPKANPIQLILPSLYSFFSKVFMIQAISGDDRTIAGHIGVNPFFVKDYIQAYRLYGSSGVENILMLLHHYNLKSIGVGSGSASDGSLMKEMVIKMMS
ncbi:MAG TPA: DNA polymerase III subunit delta [Chitinophagaceae bacterium]|nr:DNA polymerase III subunit delta [Chitinophagaceae bacterium]HPH32199.1 DNA polymerase III subunit delta [Chitinophagaceae bacterium]HPN58577.1 DNA polymerase III subunit delta [Chitinophagaceae bacterium]